MGWFRSTGEWRMAIRVVIADDDVSIREAVADLVSDEPDLELVGVADATETAVQLCLEHRPDVVLLDMRMPGGGGVHVAQVIRERGLPTQVVGLSALASPAVLREMFRLGA